MDIGAAPTKPGLKRLHVGDCVLAESARNTWFVTPAEDVTVEDMLKPAYWVHVASRMQPGDRIEFLMQNASAWGQLLVLFSEDTWAKIKLLNVVDLTEEAAELFGTDTHIATFKGHKRKWCVLRTSDNQIIRDSFGTRQEATLVAMDLNKRAA